MFCLPTNYLSVHLDLYLSSLRFIVWDVPTGESSFALPVLEQNESDLEGEV